MSDQQLLDIATELEARAAELRLLAEIIPAGVDSIPIPAAKPAPAPAPVDPVDDSAASYFDDYGAFYDFLRGNDMLGPVISADEFTGCDTIILACAREGWGVSWIAYALATAYHETAHTMLPVKEYGGTAYYKRMYDIQGNRPAKARELGNLTPGDGAKFAGRGYPQLTGRTNYLKATRKLRERGWNVDLVANPDDVLKPDVAAAVMVYGMREGWFTTRDLDDDLPLTGPGTLKQFIASRDIINGRDKAELIGGYAIDFQTGLVAAGYRQRA